MARPLELLLLLGLSFRALASEASLGTVETEEAALELIARPALEVVSLAVAEDVEHLVHRGWHDAVQALVARSQATSDEVSQKVAAQVRHAVYSEKNRLDDLIRALDRNYGKAVDVSPAMQWAQNSTHLFIAIKFCKRWNAPGALEVKNETVDFSSCCFNFTAFGEHSMILRRYQLSLELFRKVDASASSWFFASAGRVTVIIAKTAPANWPRLLLTESKTQNLGIWLDMRDKWKEDIEKLPPLETTESKKKAAASASAASSAASAAVDKKANSKKRKGK